MNKEEKQLFISNLLDRLNHSDARGFDEFFNLFLNSFGSTGYPDENEVLINIFHNMKENCWIEIIDILFKKHKIALLERNDMPVKMFIESKLLNYYVEVGKPEVAEELIFLLTHSYSDIIKESMKEAEYALISKKVAVIDAIICDESFLDGLNSIINKYNLVNRAWILYIKEKTPERKIKPNLIMFFDFKKTINIFKRIRFKKELSEYLDKTIPSLPEMFRLLEIIDLNTQQKGLVNEIVKFKPFYGEINKNDYLIRALITDKRVEEVFKSNI